jgi:hypothetical protein
MGGTAQKNLGRHPAFKHSLLCASIAPPTTKSFSGISTIYRALVESMNRLVPVMSTSGNVCGLEPVAIMACRAAVKYRPYGIARYF